MGRANRSAPLPDKTDTAANGCVSSGTGMWSREKAHGYDPDSVAAVKQPKRHLSARGLLIEAEGALEIIRRKAVTASGDKLAKLVRDTDAKVRWITKLKKEIEAS